MARRRRGKRSRRRTSKAIPVLPTVAAVLPAYKAWTGAAGDFKTLPMLLMWEYTGYNTDTGTFRYEKLAGTAGPIVVGYIAHKVANRIGVNRMIKKLTMGYLTL